MFSELSFSYESDNEWEDQPSWSDDKTKKNDEEQVFRKDPASKDSVLPTVEIIPDNDYVEWPTYCFIFPVNYIYQKTCRCVLQCLGEQCIKWWKATKFKLCGWRKRSLHNRSSSTGYSAWDQGKHQGYPPWVAQQHVNHSSQNEYPAEAHMERY